MRDVETVQGNALTFRVKRQTVLPTGDYRVVCLGVEVVDGRFGQQYRWRLLVEENDAELSAWSTMTASLRSKTVQWYSAFMGATPDEGDVIDLRRCVGKVAIASVIRRVGEDGEEYNRVESIRPVKRKAAPKSEEGGDSDNAGASQADTGAVATLKERITALGLRTEFGKWWIRHGIKEYRTLEQFAEHASQLDDEELADLVMGDPFEDDES